MKRLEKILERVFKFFSSIQLAVIVLSAIAIMSAIGTIYEARYDAVYAQKMIYHSPLMYFIMGLLCVNLINVMIDRWPWKPHHAGFIFAHVGIIILIGGSLVTRIYGVDGSMAFEIGQKNRLVMMPEAELSVFASFGDQNYKHLFGTRQDFLLRPPQKYPVTVELGSQELKVVDYYHYAVREQKIVESTRDFDGPAVRVQLQNANVNMSQWLIRTGQGPHEVMNLGPARIVLAGRGVPYEYEGGNAIVLRAVSDTEVGYEVFTESKGGRTKQGRLRTADVVEVGWMGLQLRLLKYLPKAEQKIEYVKKERPTGQTSPALQFEFDGRKQWIGLNSTVRVFDDTTMYLVSYRNRVLDVGFEMKLENFTVGRYQGTNRAKSYQSVVDVPDVGQVEISMNEPFKRNGYTFYQASFEEDEQGQPTVSVLSVNKDPGRALKYFGSFLIVLGTIMMFYFKHYRLKFAQQAKGEGS